MAKKNIKIIAFSVLLLASIGGNVYFYMRYKHTQDNDPNVQTQRIVDSLKKSTTLPDETPSVLTVVDKSKLNDSQIAEKAENGDKILLFQQSGEVYIYRPSTDKLVNILNISKPEPTEAQPAPEADTENKPTTR